MSAAIPFSSLQTDSLAELFWVNYNSLSLICGIWSKYLLALLFISLIALHFANVSRTNKLETTLRKVNKRSKSPARPF
jgi:hypothetical protein